MNRPISVFINGIERVIPEGAIAYKRADPTESAGWLYTEEEVEAIRERDPSLLIEWKPAKVVSLCERRASSKKTVCE